MKKYRPSASGLIFIRILLLLSCVAVIILSRRYLSFLPILMYTVMGVFCFAALFAVMILLPIIFAKSYYTVSNDEIQKLSGMFFVRRQFMKMSSVQYITTVITPFSSLTGLNFIIVNALGGQLILWFLSKKDALDISASLNRSIRMSRSAAHNSAAASESKGEIR